MSSKPGQTKTGVIDDHPLLSCDLNPGMNPRMGEECYVYLPIRSLVFEPRQMLKTACWRVGDDFSRTDMNRCRDLAGKG